MTVIYKVIKLYIKCNSLGVMDIVIIKFTCISSFKCLKGTSTLQANISQKGKCMKLKIFGTKNRSKYPVFDTLKDFFVIFALRLEIPFMIVHNHFKRKYFHMHSKKTFEKL